MVDRNLQRSFLLVVLVGSLLLSFLIFKPFLAPLALAAVFAVVLQPIYRKVVESVHQESVAALLTVLISVVCILVPLSFLSTQIFYEARGVYGALVSGGGGSQGTMLVAEVGRRLDPAIPGAAVLFDNFSANLDTYVKQGLEWLIGHLGSAISGATAIFLSFFVFFVALYYLLRDGRALKQALIALSPLPEADDKMISDRVVLAINSVIRGNLTIALIQGTLSGIGLVIFGVPNSILLGMTAAMASLVPGIGTASVLVPSALYLFIVGHTGAGIGLLLWGAVAVGLIDNFLGPRLIGGRMQLHPLLVLLAVLGGIAFFGPVGVFLGPISVSLLLAFITIYTYLSNPNHAEVR